jgi:RP/EB family microtubule-associated protein
MKADSIGIMDQAFFVGKNIILGWINEFFDQQLTKVEQCATGAIHCQIMDAVHPGTFNFAKVKWDAKHEHEYVENYKVLQNAFDKNGVKRHIDVAKIIKCRNLDNLELV